MEGKMNIPKIYRLLLFAMATVLLVWQPAVAKDFEVWCKQLSLYGYLSQNFQYSLHGDRYDTEQDVNSLLTNLFLEGQYKLSDELQLFTSGQLSVDWIYDVKHDDHSWKAKLFNKSRDNLYFDDEYWQILKEAHLTWTPGNFFFRAGKQIVAWGEMIGFRLLDQINPLDQRRGFIDVEFDSTIIPIWLMRSEYYLPTAAVPSWVQDLALEFTFNPNADFIPDQGIRTGNDEGGIWAPEITIPNPFPWIPATQARIASGVLNYEKPDAWDSDFFEYGVRLKGLIHGAYVTLNYFYGYNNAPVTINTPAPPPPPGAPPPMFPIASDGSVLLPGNLTGYYPLMRMVGFSIARDFERLTVEALGGVAPLFRLEASYTFDNTFGTQNPANPMFAESFDKHDDMRYAISIDWKIWMKWLNPRYSFSISPTFYHRIIRDYPHSYTLKESTGQGVEDDNYIYNVMLSTKYFHEKLVPSFFWLRDQTNSANMYRIQLTYDRSQYWHYTIGMFLLDGTEENNGFDVFENKDYIYFKVSYKWG